MTRLLTMLMRASVLVATWAVLLPSAAVAQLAIERSTIVEGTADWDWTQARTAQVPGDSPYWLTTMSQTKKQGAHGYHDVFQSVSRDRGQSWSAAEVIPALRRAEQSDGYEVVAGDLWPGWHAATRTILITGKTFNFAGGTRENTLREQVAYAVIDPASGKCSRLRVLEMPARDHEGLPILAPNAGCNQRCDLAEGDVLLPIRYQRSEKKRTYVSVVARCSFDGQELKYLEHGSEHSISTGRGLYEPSVARFGDEYFLTLRADDGAFVAKGADGIHFSDHIPWTFDDGKPLGSYNTQQHWATIGGRLYLIYTRRGADNDHIFRHRAPLFIAEVDPQRLQVVRATEQVLVPANHATLGNSGVCQITPEETWITVAEGRLSYGPRQEEDNRVILVKVRSGRQILR